MRSCRRRRPEDRAMTDARAHAAYYESEAALRLVDQELDQLRDSTDPAASVAELPLILERANQQIHTVLAHLRDVREARQRSACGTLQYTHERIRAVTAATEDAATDILDACDRARHIVDALDVIDTTEPADPGKAKALRATLRDELFRMTGALQFQDITAQQLAHASTVLMDMETRLTDLATLFSTTLSVAALPASSGAVPEAMTYDPNATTRNAEARQHLADEIFTSAQVSAA